MHGSIVLESSAISLRVSPQGGTVLEGATKDGRPFLRPYRGSADPAVDAGRTACFPLVPIGNRVEANSFWFEGEQYHFRPEENTPLYIHGDGWRNRWSVDRVEPAAVRLSFVQPRPDRSPHVYSAHQTIRLAGSVVRLELSVENRGERPLPFGIGFHPFFARTSRMLLQAAARNWWSEGPDHLPVGIDAIPAEVDFRTLKPLPRRWLNNGYEGWNGHARIVWPERRLMAQIAADSIFERFMLHATNADPSFFCFEPMSHAPNALAKTEWLGLRVLAPGERLAGGFSIAVSNWVEDDGRTT